MKILIIIGILMLLVGGINYLYLENSIVKKNDSVLFQDAVKWTDTGSVSGDTSVTTDAKRTTNDIRDAVQWTGAGSVSGYKKMVGIFKINDE